MDTNAIVSLISSVGFPIVCVIFLWQFVSNTMKDFTKNINENTVMLQRIYEKLDNLDDKEGGKYEK